MIRDLFTWWAEQMRDLVPASLRVRPAVPTGLVASVDEAGSTVSLVHRTRRGRIELGRFALDDPGLGDAVARRPGTDRAVTVEVAEDAVLRHQTVLPLSAELDLRALLAFELDRFTPFRADQAYWSAAVERRDAKAGRLHVRLLLAPHRLVQPAVAALSRAGLEPARIVAAGEAGAGAIALGAERPPPAWAGRRAQFWAAGACAALALLAAALPFVQQSLAAAALEARIAALRPELTEAERLRRQIAASRGTADVVTAARGQIGQPMQALAVLTDVLPDDTVLSQLSARQRTLTLTGRAASAAKLIGSMTALPALRAPAFTAAVVRDEATGTEAFTIRTELAP